MADGTHRAVEDIGPDDSVLGDNSRARRVANTVKIASRPLYRMSPKIGDSVLLGDGSDLALVKVSGPARGTLVAMPLEEYLSMPHRQRATLNWYRVPVDFDKARTQACADATDTDKMMCAAPTDSDTLAYLHGFFMDGTVSLDKRKFVQSVFRHTRLSVDLGVGGEFSAVDDALLDALFGGTGSQWTATHIPDFVKYGKTSVRAEYLAGALDTSSYNKVTKRFDLAVASETLCRDLLFVASSLGYYCSYICNTKYSFAQGKHQRVYLVYVYPNTNTCMPSRIFDIVPIKTQFPNLFSTDFNVEAAAPGVVYGLVVDGRFLLSDFSVVGHPHPA